MSRHQEWDIRCKVYVGNLGNNASKSELESVFSHYGPLKNVWVARNPPGFAFIEFQDPRDAEDACRNLDGTRVSGMRIRVEMSTGRSRDRRPPPRGGGGGGGRHRSRSRSPVRGRGGRGGRSGSRSPSPRPRRSRSFSRDRRHRSRSYSD